MVIPKPAEFVHQQDVASGYARRGVLCKYLQYDITRAGGMAIIRQLVRL
jgi:hypothetical protein